MNELVLRIKQNPGTIELNFDELNKQMDAKLAEYKGAVFTEETKDIAKGEVASLRKLKKDVDSARIATKKEWMKPLEAFEKQMKELSGKVDEPIHLIDDQLKEFEADRKAEKRAKIEAVYEETVGDMREYLPLNRIYDPKWENVSATMKSVKESIVEIVERTREAVSMIQGMQSDAVEKGISIYKDTLDLSKAISYINSYEKQKAEIMQCEAERRKEEEERRRREEEERIRAQEREAIERENRIREQAEREAELARQEEKAAPFESEKTGGDEVMPFVQPDTKTVIYCVVATEEEIQSIDMALDSIGVYYERRDG